MNAAAYREDGAMRTWHSHEVQSAMAALLPLQNT
jgi:hypothetical protein